MSGAFCCSDRVPPSRDSEHPSSSLCFRPLRWFCHVDDDNYVNVRTLVKFLSQYPHTQDMYVGKPSLDRPIEATERLGDNKMVRGGFSPRFLLGSCWASVTLCWFSPPLQKPVNFWFATGGAGFCVSRGLALKMSPWAR